VLGVLLYFIARDVLGGLTETWLLWFGLMFVVPVMVRPEGLAGLAHLVRQRLAPSAKLTTSRERQVQDGSV